MGFFENLGRKVGKFTHEAKEAAADGAAYACTDCGAEFYTEQEACPECGSERVIEREPDTDSDESVADSNGDGSGADTGGDEPKPKSNADSPESGADNRESNPSADAEPDDAEPDDAEPRE
jgi:DNA-directed RNA polymerase subunit RPC12/RpoP